MFKKNNYNLDSNLHFMFQQLSLMEWTDKKDLLLLHEILLLEPFKHKPGSKQQGSLWTRVSKNLVNSHPGFSVTQRAKRYHFWRRKQRKGEMRLTN